MNSQFTDPLSYYAQQGSISDPGEFSTLLSDLPKEIPSLCRIVQGLVIHNFWAKEYGVRLSQERMTEVQTRHASRILARCKDIDAGPFTKERPPEKRFVGNCRTFSVLLVAILRSQGVPARARCGFGSYFTPGRHEDHWVCEYWDATSQRWILVDAQLDDLQCQVLKISFDPLDVPRDQFLVGGHAWQMCRNQGADPDTFGIFDMKGLWFVRGNLVRDIAALNKMALLPWDIWGLIEGEDKKLSQADWDLLDQMAAASASEADYAVVRTQYETEPRLRVPEVIQSFVDGRSLRIDLASELSAK